MVRAGYPMLLGAGAGAGYLLSNDHSLTVSLARRAVMTQPTAPTSSRWASAELRPRNAVPSVAGGCTELWAPLDAPVPQRQRMTTKPRWTSSA